MKALSKILALILISGLTILIFQSALAESSSSTQKCDQTSLEASYQAANYLPTYNPRDTTVSWDYTLVFSTQKIEITFQGNKLTNIPYIPFNPTEQGKIVTCGEGMLEVVIVNKDGQGKSYFFISGQEIRQLQPEITEVYFRTKINKDKEIFFDFKNGSFGFKNLKTKEFCRTKPGA